jgi:protein-tyrosine phosphatase
MTDKYDRHLRFNSVVNFRDIGGYRGYSGKTVAWRRVFRSGEFRRITPEDIKRLIGELGVTSIIDLRSELELANNGKGLLPQTGIKYCNISFMPDGGDPEANAQRFKEMTCMGEFYIELARQKNYGKKIVEALEVIAEPGNHPLIFHCAVGKDRTGMLAAMLLHLLGVSDADIIQDYALSEPYMDELLVRFKAAPREKDAKPPPPIPDFFWKAPPDSMGMLLAMLRREYGSVEGYLNEMGMPASIPKQLQKGLLQ